MNQNEWLKWLENVTVEQFQNIPIHRKESRSYLEDREIDMSLNSSFSKASLVPGKRYSF